MVRPPFLAKALQPFNDKIDPFLPGKFFPAPFSSLSFSFQRMANSIRIVKDLKSGLALWAEPSSIDRVIPDPFELDWPVVDRPDSKPATAGTLETDTG
jgi:hypothetical protein